MNAKRAKYASIKEELVPVLIQGESGEAQYGYATFSTSENCLVSVASLSAEAVTDEDELQGEQEVLADPEEVIIDENGEPVTLHQLVSNECHELEEVEAIEEADGTHTILHIVPSNDEAILSDEGLYTQDEVSADTSITMSPTDMAANNNAKQKTFYCQNCGNCYSAAGSLKLHMRACLRQRKEVPPEDRKCNICNKVFNSVTYLKEHVLRHSGLGPERCTRCYRKFIDKEKFKAHVESHKQQDKLSAEAALLAKEHGGRKIVLKEYTCSFCACNFTVVFDNCDVKRRYACDECRERYSNAEMLKKHKQQVEDKRDFHCERCGRKFVFEGFLQRHLPTCDGTIKRRRDMK